LHTPRDTDLGRLAVNLALLPAEQARWCLAAAREQNRGFLETALGYRLLTPEQARLLQARSSALDQSEPAWANPPLPSTHLAPPGERPADRRPLPAPGERVDGYQLTALLGRGGMGAVYAARKDGRALALKFITSDDPTALARFEREAHALSTVDRHPNIVRI